MLQTHSARHAATEVTDAVPAFGEVRWIEVGSGIRDVTASPGRVAAVIEDGTIVSFDLASGARTTTRPADQIAVPEMLSLSPDGTLLVVCVGEEVSLLDIARGTYGIVRREARCSAPALWSPDGHVLYVMEAGGSIVAFDVRTGASPGRAEGLGSDAFVLADGTIVGEDGEDHHVLVLDPQLATLGTFTMPELPAQHGSPGISFLLGALDHETFVYACGEGGYDVALVRGSTLDGVVWQAPESQTWRGVTPLNDERAFVLVERDDGSVARVIGVRTGESLFEVPDVVGPYAVSADRSLAVAVSGTRLAVIGVR